MSPRPEAQEPLPSRATVERPAATLAKPRRRAWASLRSLRNWQQLGKFCAVGAVGYLINLAVYDGLLHEGPFLIEAGEQKKIVHEYTHPHHLALDPPHRLVEFRTRWRPAAAVQLGEPLNRGQRRTQLV